MVFVAPYAMDATMRFLSAMVDVSGANVGVVSSDPLDRFPSEVRRRFAGHWQTSNCLDVDELTHSVGQFQAHMGEVDVLTAILENIQVPMAHVRERLGIDGMGVEVAERFRDKALMKKAFETAGVPCARNAQAGSADEARAVLTEISGPAVVKPLAGMGAQDTFRIDNADVRERWLAQSPPTPDRPVLIEEFLVGQEFSFESVLIDGRLVWHSIGRYDPTPLTVLENPWIQWCVVLPRDIGGDEFSDIRHLGAKAIKALGMETGLSHLEWFRRSDGSIAISEVGARPPGAQIASLMSWAHDADLYAGWAHLLVHGEFDPPERKYAVGAAYLRAQGAGRSITSVSGIDQVSDQTKSLVVESHLPTVGSPPADTYEGDGYVIVRAATTAEVDAAISELVSMIRVESS